MSYYCTLDDLNEILKNLIRMNHSSSRKLRISIEGNIASGKTTIIKYLKEVVENSNRSNQTSSKSMYDYDLNENSAEINLVDSCLLFNQRVNVKIIPEPVDLWRNLNGTNLLDLMYKDPHRWALAFHSYVQLTMLENHLRLNEKPSPAQQQHQQCVLSPKASNQMGVQSPTKTLLSPSKYNKANLENQSPIKASPIKSSSEPFNINIMERSLFSARYCFVENLYRCNVLQSVEYEILDKWFNWMTEAHDCNLDVIFYLKTNPQTCLQRLNKRGRSEETSTVSLDYLQKINDLHEEWLGENSFKLNNRDYYKPPKIIVIDADQSIDDVYKSMELETRNSIAMRV